MKTITCTSLDPLIRYITWAAQLVLLFKHLSVIIGQSAILVLVLRICEIYSYFQT